MSSNKGDLIWSNCNRCHQDTRHDILEEVVGDGGEEYHCYIQHAIVECRGCGTKSFRYNFKDFENAFPIDGDEWDIPEEVMSYPKFEDPSLQIEGIQFFPDIVASIYKETISAIQEKAFILAGLGLRGTVEAVCNEQNISGRNLEVRIKGLVTKGLISKQDGERLHAIRFLGNDAAHDIKKPKQSQISVALKIIKHLVASVYTLKSEADGMLDTLITEYQEYIEIINERLINFNSGDEVTINAILSKDIRRIGENKSDLENRLILEISSGSYTKLKVGKKAKVAGSKDEFQHFVIT